MSKQNRQARIFERIKRHGLTPEEFVAEHFNGEMTPSEAGVFTLIYMLRLATKAAVKDAPAALAGFFAEHIQAEDVARDLDSLERKLGKIHWFRKNLLVPEPLIYDHHTTSDDFRAPISPALRFSVLIRDNFCCRYCGAHPPQVVLEIDHVQSVADGGKTVEENLVASCFECNRGKAGRSVDVSTLP